MFDLTTDLNSYLAPGERVVWQGQGKRRMNSSAMGGYFFAVMFAVVGLMFAAVFVSLMSTSRSTRGFDPFMFILPIFIIAIGLGVGLPWILLARRTGNARYYVTNSSALIVYASGARSGKRVTVMPLKNLQQLTLSENRDGTGTLTLASSPYAAYGRYSNSWVIDSVPTFANIERPQEVYQLIRKQMDELNSR